jgi:hypothetical protein
VRTRRPRCRLPEPLTPDPLDWRVFADALEECGRDREAARARRTALALERGVKAVLWGQDLGDVLRRGVRPHPVRPADWRVYDLCCWYAPRAAPERRFLTTPWDYPGLPEALPGLVRAFLCHLATRVRLPKG